MESLSNSRGPKVRIGVIQSTEVVEFHVNKPYKLVNADGEIVGIGKRNAKSRMQIKSGQAAKINYQIRLAKLKQKAEADEYVRKLAGKKIEARLRHIGEVIEIAGSAIDNREYWIVTGKFDTYKQVEKAKATFVDTEDNTIIEEIVSEPVGVIGLAAKELGEVVRIIPDMHNDTRITIHNVIVGIEFHWQRLEVQDYRGIIEIRFNNDGQLCVINELDLEDYLISVNSSEMTPDCPMDLLKAQTVAARSTILATMGKHHYSQNFHLCADDHCQCYRGTTYESNTSMKAVNETLGESLLFEGEVCDARYAKICGGVMESYENVWENKKIAYLCAGVDGDIEIELPLDTEEKARAYIDSYPDAYCNTELYQLPKMLEYSNHLFRWEVIYRRQELEEIINEKSNADIGQLVDIIPLERGISGRLKLIEIVGTNKRLKIKKELNIRRIFSRSHLYSSCFYVKRAFHADGSIDTIAFIGAGWGHGVGLCQVGATIMAEKGFAYNDILAHYYKGTEVVKLY